MKILVCGDTHGSKALNENLKRKAREADFVIHLGDFTWGNYNVENELKFLNTLGKDVIVLHGNHESENEVRMITQKLENVTFLHKDKIEINGYTFLSYGGGGFARFDQEFEELSHQFSLWKTDKTILLLHGPPHGTKVDDLGDNIFTGNMSVRNWIEANQPLYAFSGHIHETFGKIDRVGKTTLINPGPKGIFVQLK